MLFIKINLIYNMNMKNKKTRKRKNKKTRKIYKGGKLIEVGSKSCIFKPNIPCDKYDKPKSKKVSKLVFKNPTNEYKMNNHIKKIPNYKKYFIVFDKLCNTPDYKFILKNDNNINDCLKYFHINKNELSNSYMLTGNSAEITLKNYFKKKIKNKSLKNIEKIFLEIMEKMINIFIGVIILKNNNISHLDIKPENIMLDKECFKLIDFGLSSKFNDIEHFKQRAYSEADTNRIYIWYPSSFLLSQLSYEELVETDNYIKNYKFSNYKNDANIYENIRRNFKQTTYRTYTQTIEYYIKVRTGTLKYRTGKDIEQKFI